MTFEDVRQKHPLFSHLSSHKETAGHETEADIAL